MSPALRRMRPLALVLGLTVALAGCDDQVKRVPWFKTMFRTASVRTYEAELPTPPEGTVHYGAQRHFDVLAADTLLSNPLQPTPEVLERGEVLYLQFCVMCHGETGAGDGPVVGENRLPPLPTLNLLSERAMTDLSDGYIWGREFLSKREGKRRRVSEQQWYMFLMWGYLAYDPKIPDGRFKALLAEKYPGADRDALFEAMASASRVYPLTTSFFWRPLDFQWIPEFCFGWHRAYKKIGYRGFYDIKDFMNNEPLEGAGVQSIANWVATCKSEPCSRQGVRSPLDVAADLEANASRALELLTRVEGESGGGEWEETVNDIRAMALLGLYYSA